MLRLASLSLLPCLLLGLGSGCTPPVPDPGPPYSATLWDYDFQRGDYSLQDQLLPTLQSLKPLSGEVTTITGGVDLVVSMEALGADAPTTPADFDRLLKTRGGDTVDLRYVVDDGVLIPEDFGTLLLLSYYRSLERARDYFQGADFSPQITEHLNTYHLPTISIFIIAGLPLFTDNAGFSSFFDGFAIFPRELLADYLPLAMNLGVIGHEYTHAVIHRLTAGDGKLPIDVLDSWPPHSSNVLRAIHEGMADVFGALLTNDSNFMGRSVPLEISEPRDLSVRRAMTEFLYESLEFELIDYDPYAIGSVLASVFWELGVKSGRQVMEQVAIQSLLSLGEQADENLSLEIFSEIMVRATPQEERQVLCSTLQNANLPTPRDCL